jgi:restriction endonuclease Mrr
LAALMIEHSVGVRTEEKIILQAIDEEFFDPS